MATSTDEMNGYSPGRGERTALPLDTHGLFGRSPDVLDSTISESPSSTTLDTRRRAMSRSIRYASHDGERAGMAVDSKALLDLNDIFTDLISALRISIDDHGLPSTKHLAIRVCLGNPDNEDLYAEHTIDSIPALYAQLESYHRKPCELYLRYILDMLRQVATTKVADPDLKEDIYIKLFYQYLYDTFAAYDALRQSCLDSLPPPRQSISSSSCSSSMDSASSSSDADATIRTEQPDLLRSSDAVPILQSLAGIAQPTMTRQQAEAFLQSRLTELIPTLRQLRIINDKLGTKDKRLQRTQFLSFIMRRPLVALRLDNCDLDGDDIKAISYALLGNDLQVFDFSNNPKVTGEAISALCFVLKHMPEPALEQLVLPHIKLNNFQLRALVEVLTSDQSRIHMLLMTAENRDAFLKTWGSRTRVDLTAAYSAFSYRGTLLLDFPAKKLTDQSIEIADITQVFSDSPIYVSSVDRTSSPANSSDSTDERSQVTLLTAVTSLRDGLKTLIKDTFFEVAWGGGTSVPVDGKDYNVPDTIANIYSILDILLPADKIPTDEMIKSQLDLVYFQVSEKSRRAAWRQDPMSALCYSLLRDTCILNDAMREVARDSKINMIQVVSKETFHCTRLVNLIPVLKAIKTLINRLTVVDETAADLLKELTQGEDVRVLDLTHANLSLQEIQTILYLLPSCKIRNLKLNSTKLITDVTLLTQVLPYLNNMNALVLGPTQLSESGKASLYTAAVNASCKVTTIKTWDKDMAFSIRLANAAQLRPVSRNSVSALRTEALLASRPSTSRSSSSSQESPLDWLSVSRS